MALTALDCIALNEAFREYDKKMADRIVGERTLKAEPDKETEVTVYCSPHHLRILLPNRVLLDALEKAEREARLEVERLGGTVS